MTKAGPFANTASRTRSIVARCVSSGTEGAAERTSVPALTRRATEKRSGLFPRNRSSARHAFTLLELLVAAGLTVVLAGFVAVVIRDVGATWSRASGRLGADAQARFVLDALQLDLQGALFLDDGGVWLAAEVLNDATDNSSGLWQPAGGHGKPAGGHSLHLASPDVDNARFGAAGVWLSFFTTNRGANLATTPGSLSAPVAVGYQIIRRFSSTDSGNFATAYMLHRAVVRPGAADGATHVRPGTLESGYDLAAAPYTNSTAGSNDGSATGDPRSIQSPGGVRNLDSVIADNVIDFGVRCYVREAGAPEGLRLIFPVSAGGATTDAAGARLRSTLPPWTPAARWNGAQPFPEIVDIMVRILTDEGARLIARLEGAGPAGNGVPRKYAGNAAQWWWGVAEENSRVYSRRIRLGGNAP